MPSKRRYVVEKAISIDDWWIVRERGTSSDSEIARFIDEDDAHMFAAARQFLEGEWSIRPAPPPDDDRLAKLEARVGNLRTIVDLSVERRETLQRRVDHQAAQIEDLQERVRTLECPPDAEPVKRPGETRGFPGEAADALTNQLVRAELERRIVGAAKAACLEKFGPAADEPDRQVRTRRIEAFLRRYILDGEGAGQ